MNQLLREARFLDEVSSEDLEKLQVIASVEHVKPSTILFQEGTVCERLYLVTSGLIALDMCIPRRGCVRILTVGPGEIVGWSELLGKAAMTARATVVVSSTLVSFPTRQLRDLCDADHDVGYAVMTQISISLSRRLLATRLQMLDVFSETQSAGFTDSPSATQAT